MKKKSSPQPSVSVPSETSTPEFLTLENRVFTQIGKDIYIGREKVAEPLRDSLRDEAQNLEKTRLWEILNASVVNEAYNMALIQSQDFDAVLSAKMLHHWSHFMRNVIHILAQKD